MVHKRAYKRPFLASQRQRIAKYFKASLVEYRNIFETNLPKTTNRTQPSKNNNIEMKDERPSPVLL